MRKIPKISEAEWEVIKVIWAKSSATANEVIAALSPQTAWSPKTIRTLITRLVKKKALGCKKGKPEYLFYPLVKEKDYIRAESFSFLQRIFGGSLKPMLAHFLENQNLTREEIEELKAMLDGKEELK